MPYIHQRHILPNDQFYIFIHSRNLITSTEKVY
jgi:hypothetical protein